MNERYDRLLIRQRECREQLADGDLGFWKRFTLVTVLDRIQREIAELGAPAFTGEQDDGYAYEGQDECPGHPDDGEFNGPIGETHYCDGSCVTHERLSPDETAP